MPPDPLSHTEIPQRRGCNINRLFSFRDSRMKQREHRRWANRLLTAVTFLCSAVFLLSVAMLLKNIVQGEQEQASFEALKAGISNTEPGIPEETDSRATPAEERQPSYTAYYSLYEQNNDFAAWLTIPGTKVDYPVMYTPQEPEYYLRRAFDGTGTISGTPFIGDGGTPDSDMFIIYGHKMKNGTMFGTLNSYEEADFWEDNRTFTLTTITEERKYEVFAAIKTRVLYRDESGYRPFSKAGDLTKEEYAELTTWLKDNALYDTGITPIYGDQILLLVTCSYHTDNGRFLVAARRLTDDIDKNRSTDPIF